MPVGNFNSSRYPASIDPNQLNLGSSGGYLPGGYNPSASYAESSLAGINPLAAQNPGVPGSSMGDVGYTASQARQMGAAAPGGANAAPLGGTPGAASSSFPGTGQYSSGWTEPGLGDLPRNPAMMLKDIFDNRYGGINHDQRGTGLYYQTLPYMANANALAMLSNPNTMMTQPAYADWLGNFASNMMRPGQFTDTNAMLHNLFNPGGGSMLGNYLGLGDSANQVSNTLGVLKAALDQGMHPMYAQAMMAKAAQQATDWQSRVGHGEAAGPFYQDLGGQQLFNRF